MSLLYPLGVSFQCVVNVFLFVNLMVKYNFHWTFAFYSIICLRMIGYYCISIIFSQNGCRWLMCKLGITYYSLNLLFKYIWYPINMIYVVIILDKLVLGNHNDIKPRRLLIWLWRSRLLIWLTYNLRSGFLHAWNLLRFAFTNISLVITLNPIYKLDISLFISLRDKYTHKTAFRNLLSGIQI